MPWTINASSICCAALARTGVNVYTALAVFAHKLPMEGRSFQDRAVCVRARLCGSVCVALCFGAVYCIY